MAFVSLSANSRMPRSPPASDFKLTHCPRLGHGYPIFLSKHDGPPGVSHTTWRMSHAPPRSFKPARRVLLSPRLRASA